MRILIICQTMTYLSGSPLYHYTLAKELKRQGHDVFLFSMWSDNSLRKGMDEAGVMTWYDKPQGEYDLIIISQKDHEDVLDNVRAKKVINIVHSEYDPETPITDKHIDEYVAIRPSIKQHLIECHDIPANKIRIVYNGVDMQRFHPKKRKETNLGYTKVVLPCTLDMLRKQFIEYYTKRATKNYQIFIYGKDFGNDIYRNEWVHIHDEVPDIENYIADADFVAGILLGRVNLEARAMGILSFIHDPMNPEDYCTFFPEDEEFVQRHDIINVAKQLIA